MSSRRTLILLGAVALGVLAAFALFSYVSGIEDREKDKFQLVSVFKATETITRGTLGDDAIAAGMVERQDIPREFEPEGAIRTLDEINGKVAIFDIPTDIPITAGMFVDTSQVQVSFRERLTNPDWVTVSVSADQTGGVGGLLVPGDEVNIMVLTEIDTDLTQTGPGLLLDSQYQMLYQRVHILAIGQTTQLAPGEEADPDAQQGGGGVITFNVPSDAAQLIASVRESLYLSLVAEDYQPVALPALPITIDPLPGQDPAQLTPYGPDGTGAE